MKNLTFNISETSHITGLSIDTLRYYDKIDLIKSKKNPNNHYRYYTMGDISIINHIKNLRDLDLSINDIKLLLNSNTEVQESILKNHHQVLLDKLASIKKIEQIFKDSLEKVNSTNLLINVPLIKYHPERYFKKLKNTTKSNKCSISKKSLINNSNNFHEIIDKFVFPFEDAHFDSKCLFDFFDFGKICENQQYYTEISEEDITRYNYKNELTNKNNHIHCNTNESDFIHIPKSYYIETITQLSKNTFDEYFQNLIEWINFKNLEPVYPGFIKYLDTSLYFIEEGECLIKFEIPFTHKKYD